VPERGQDYGGITATMAAVLLGDRLATRSRFI